MEKHRAHRRHKALATSFVITIGTASAAIGEAGCKKQNVNGTSSLRRQPDGYCYLDHYVSCPRNATCNPPPPTRVDCPPELRDAGDPPTPSRRPPGKEKWLRIPPRLWTYTTECTYQPESFCPPPEANTACFGSGESVKVACTLDADAGTRELASFVYTNAFGECRKVPAGPCISDRRGDCSVSEGEVVPCPPPASSKPRP